MREERIGRRVREEKGVRVCVCVWLALVSVAGARDKTVTKTR